MATRKSRYCIAMIRCTAPFNATHLPALSLPCGFTRGGLPVGMQIAGRPFDEATVLRVGHAVMSRRWTGGRGFRSCNSRPGNGVRGGSGHPGRSGLPPPALLSRKSSRNQAAKAWRPSTPDFA